MRFMSISRIKALAISMTEMDMSNSMVYLYLKPIQLSLFQKKRYQLIMIYTIQAHIRSKTSIFLMA